MNERIIDTVIRPRLRELGDGFQVRRVLPSGARRLVGPFIFFDHFGPLALPVGRGLDVRPHPHINLATVTYLFDGEIVHRDSLGSLQTIKPGDVNWMTAGRGIVHSERSSAEQRRLGPRLHGLQSWVALPTALEESEPSFQHVAGDHLPALEGDGVKMRIVAGSAFGQTAPVAVLSPLFYVAVQLAAEAVVTLPDDHAERALYVVAGQVTCDGQTLTQGEMAVFLPDTLASARAIGPGQVMLLGGAPLDGTRHVEWNFVSSRPERIEAAKTAWKAGHFPKVPGDEVEFIPLPEG
jgi:redox-sensitive bicupin YhaK (pirin superfamily)